MEPATAHRQLEITLLQERSAGTFARVYLAEASGADGLSRIVAVKVLKEQWSESSDLLDRTRDEARLLARLRHKNILRVEAMAELDGQPAIIMELVDGLDLKQLVERLAETGERIPPRTAYSIAQQSASALEAAYFRVPYGMEGPLHVVHRDVKPSNIMVSCEGEVKVLDFGTARYQWEGRLAQTGALRFGSLKYMSPERQSGDRGDHASDMYALGLVTIEMLRGASLPLLPLETAKHDETLRQVVAALPDLGMPNDDWVKSLRETLLRMCSAEPELRLDAQQVAQLLRAFSDQASGTSLDSFAASTITRLNRQIYGGGAEGALSGSRIFVHMTGSGKGASAAPGVSPVEGGGVLAAADTPVVSPDAVPDPGASSVIEVPGRPGPADPFSYELPSMGGADDGFERTPVFSDPSEEQPTVQQRSIIVNHGASVTAPAVGLQPGRGQVVRPVTPQPAPIRDGAPSGSPRTQAGRAPHPGPEHGRHGQSDQPFAQPTMVGSQPTERAHAGGQHQWAAPAEEPSGGGSKLLIGLAFLLAAVLVFLVVSVLAGGAAAWFVLLPEPPSGTVETPTTPPALAAGDLTVSLEAADETLQWVRLESAEGERVLNAKPADEADLAEGDYTLSAKQAGRQKVEVELSLSTSLSLSCAPVEEGRVRCADEAQDVELLLSP